MKPPTTHPLWPGVCCSLLFLPCSCPWPSKDHVSPLPFFGVQVLHQSWIEMQHNQAQGLRYPTNGAGKWLGFGCPCWKVSRHQGKKKRCWIFKSQATAFFHLKLLEVFGLLISVIGLTAAEWSQALHGECFFSQEVTKPKAAKASSCSCVSPFLLFFFLSLFEQ